MTNYQKGAAHERAYCKRMEANGYVAIRSAGSHGMIDVVLIPTTNANNIRVMKRIPAMEKNEHVWVNGEVAPSGVFVCQLKRGAANTKKEKALFSKMEFGCEVHKLWVSRKDREAEVIELL